MIYLYVKTHNITGLKYFGKTETKDPVKYLGSGKYWLRHLKKYGTDISTEIVASFENREEASIWAVSFSHENDIIESPAWANLMLETVKDGVLGYIHTDETRKILSEKSKARWSDFEYKEEMKEKHRKRLEDERERYKCGNAFRGKKRPEHAEKLTGRILSEEHRKTLCVPKRAGHGSNVSAALKGKPKSQQHREALSGKKRRICRLIDKKEMSINHFGRWLKTISPAEGSGSKLP